MNTQKKMLEDEVLSIIESYGNDVDSQGWEIPERFEAVRRILKIFGIGENS